MKTVNVPTLFFDHRDTITSAFERMADQLMNDMSFPMLVERIRPLAMMSFPKVDVVEFDDKITIYSDIPGYKKEDISVKVVEGVLTISGKANKDKSEEYKAGKVLIKELSHTQFSRAFVLGDNLSDSIEAEFKDAVLKIDIAKKTPEKEKSTTIEIK